MKYAILAICLLGCASLGLSAKCDAFKQEMYELGLNVGQDKCHRKFAPYVRCIATELESSVNTVIDESNPQAQADAKTCFKNARINCNDVAYNKERALNTFLPCPYTNQGKMKQECVFRYVAEKIIEALDETPKAVGKCMIKFFKGIGQRKIEDCTREYPPNINPPFKMPEIPGFDNFELEDLKNVLLYHLMTRYHLGKCTQCKVDGNTNLIRCLADQAKDEAQDTCEIREGCEEDVLKSNCKGRYLNTKTAICTCVKTELKKGVQALQDWKAVKNLFVRGDFDCQMEECYKQEGLHSKWGKMQNLLKEIKRGAIKAIAKLQLGSAPPQVAEALVVFKNILDELVSKWGGLYCGTCESSGSPSELRYDAYVKLLESEGCYDAQKAVDDADLLGPVSEKDSEAIDDFFSGRK